MKEKVKALVLMPGYASIGEMGIVIEEFAELSGEIMRVVKFKEGGYAIFGNVAFSTMLKVVK